MTASEENGIGVVRASLNQYVPLNPKLSTLLARRQLENAWNRYVEEFGVPDVLHAHSLYPGAYIAKALSERHGIPFVYTEHRALKHLKVRGPWSRTQQSAVARAAASRQAVSEGHASHLAARFGMEPESWLYVPNLLPREALVGAEPEQHAGFVYGHMSLLGPEKGVDLLIEAFARVHADDPSTRLLIGGSGGEESRLRSLVTDLDLEDSVEFVGFVPREEIGAFYGRIDAFVLPSRSETMGVAQIEALASGVPVISTRTWGGESVVQEGDGLLVEIDDPDGLASAMLLVRSWDETQESKRDRALRCVARFGEEAFVSRYGDIYEEAFRVAP